MIDLHMHTVASDGVLTAGEILTRCEALGLTHIAITDHFSVGAYKDLQDPAVRGLFSGKILPGCEYSVHYQGGGIEVLGYGVPIEAAAPYIQKHYPPMVERQRLLLELMIRLYRERGFLFNEERLRTVDTSVIYARLAMYAEINQHEENRRLYICPESRESEKSFSRNEVGNPDSPFFVDMSHLHPSLKEVCDFIHANGGKAILAHPCSYDAKTQSMLGEMIPETGLDGLEVYYPGFTPEQREMLLGHCKRHGLIFSTGSDYHRESRAKRYGNILGLAGVGFTPPVEEILAWVQELPLI